RWPRTPAGELNIVVRYSQKWRDLTDAQRLAFSQQSLTTTWSPTSTDLTFPALGRSHDRNYVSNGWGVAKSVYA
ncbi:MAG: hypothetical protein ACREFP_07415, partial [Acetobacteraceae bacterium]